MKYRIVQLSSGRYVCRVYVKFLWFWWKWKPVWYHSMHDNEREFDTYEDAYNTLTYYINQMKIGEKVIEEIII